MIQKLSYFLIGCLCSYYGKTQNIHVVDSLNSLLETNLTPKEKVDLLVGLADEYDNVDSAITVSYAKEAIAIGEKLQYAQGISDANYKIAWVTMQAGNLHQAKKLYKSVLQHAIDNGYQKGMSNAFNGLGIVVERFGDLDSAEFYYKKALEIRLVLGIKKAISSSYGNLGLVYMYQGNLVKSLEYHQKAAKLAEDTQDLQRLAHSHHNIAAVYDEQSRFEDALINYKKALNIYLKLGQKMYVAMVYGTIAISYKQLADYDSAMLCYNKSMQLAEEIGYTELIANNNLNIGGLLIYQDRPDQAKPYILKGLEISQKIGNKHSLATAYNALGKIYYQLGQYDKAKKNLQTGISISEANGYASFAGDGYEALIKVERALGNYEEALESYDIFLQLYDSLLGVEKSRQFSQLQVQYETEKKEQEITTLSQQTTIQSLELKQSKLQLSILGIAVVLLVMFVAIIYMVNRQKRFRLIQRSHDMEQKLLRVQMNPHFIFNAMTSIQDYMMQGDPTQAGIYLTKFSKLIRQVLDNSRSEYISLEQEIKMLENYLSIQNIRMDRPFNYDIAVDQSIDPEAIAIPPMFAQPFVENAIEHGITETVSGDIRIRFSLHGDQLTLKISDNGVGVEGQATIQREDHISHATAITKERVKLFRQMTRQNITFNIRNIYPGTEVTFNLPFQHV